MMASSYFISCTNLETKLSEHFKVPHSIYVYVKQLECQIYKLKKENCNEGDKTMSVSDSFDSYDDLDYYDRFLDDTALKISREILNRFL